MLEKVLDQKTDSRQIIKKNRLHHRVLIIGGGTAGLTVAARLLRRGLKDIGIIEPSKQHYYQPAWTLVGAGAYSAEDTVRLEADVMPRGVRWIEDYAEEIDPINQYVATRGGCEVGYDFLVVAPGIQLDFCKVAGLEETLGKNNVSTNYRFDLAPKTWQFLQKFKGAWHFLLLPARLSSAVALHKRSCTLPLTMSGARGSTRIQR